jgi:hypothetical protein
MSPLAQNESAMTALQPCRLLGALIVMVAAGCSPSLSNPSSAEGPRVDGKPHGPWKFLDGRGNVTKSGEFVDGLESGKWSTWYENGKLAAEETFLKGKRHGPFIAYHENGKKREEGQYQNGKPVGVHSQFTDKGDLFRKWHCNDAGERHGPYEMHGAHGVTSGEYVNGKKHGLWIEWIGEHSENRVECTFENDVLVKKEPAK